MRRGAELLWTPLLFLAGGCGDASAPTEPAPGPSWLISDAVHGGGNAHFFWLPPMVSQPQAVNGVFDAGQSPIVRICDLADCGGMLIAEFTMATGPGSETVRVEPAEEHYIANWHTSDSPVTPGPTYRIAVLLDGVTLGYADIQLGATGKDVKNLTTDEIIGLKDGRTLPITFRIEEGAAVGFRFVTVDAGERQTCALANDGTAWCWGDHGFGQSGSGLPLGNFFAPRLVLGGHTWASVLVAQGEFSCGVTTSEDGFCFGRNNEMQLGTLTPTQPCFGGRVCVPTPAPVAGELTWASLEPGGQSYTCGLTTGLAAWCWGTNSFGLGDAAVTTQSNTPVAVAGGLSFIAIATGGAHACGVTPAHQMYCWGVSFQGQGGRGTTTVATTPVPVSGTEQYVSVAASTDNTCAITVSATAFCWGNNGNGQVGDGTTVTRLVPTPVAGGLQFESITTGRLGTPTGHTCGITLDGDAWCWGRNALGQLGDGTLVDRSTPGLVPGGHRWQSLSAGTTHTCGVTTAGAVYCWGGNIGGQLGNVGFDSDPHPVPAQVPFPM